MKVKFFQNRNLCHNINIYIWINLTQFKLCSLHLHLTFRTSLKLHNYTVFQLSTNIIHSLICWFYIHMYFKINVSELFSFSLYIFYAIIIYITGGRSEIKMSKYQALLVYVMHVKKYCEIKQISYFNEFYSSILFIARFNELICE